MLITYLREGYNINFFLREDFMLAFPRKRGRFIESFFSQRSKLFNRWEGKKKRTLKNA